MARLSLPRAFLVGASERLLPVKALALPIRALGKRLAILGRKERPVRSGYPAVALARGSLRHAERGP